jgi:hypothetical protein
MVISMTMTQGEGKKMCKELCSQNSIHKLVVKPATHMT